MRFLLLVMSMVVVTKHLLDAFMACCVGRRDDYAYQRSDGRYYRAGCPLTYDVVYRHLQGVQTIGSYLIDEYGLCRFAVFDSDASSGLVDLLQVQTQLAGVPSYLELSRRGAHLRVFFRNPASPALVRRWLLPYCPAGVEFYPKQDALSDSVMRIPRCGSIPLPILTFVAGIAMSGSKVGRSSISSATIMGFPLVSCGRTFWRVVISRRYLYDGTFSRCSHH